MAVVHAECPRRQEAHPRLDEDLGLSRLPQDSLEVLDDVLEALGVLLGRLRELAFLNPGLEITLVDERSESAKRESFLYKHGIEEFVRQLGENKQVLEHGRAPVRWRPW